MKTTPTTKVSVQIFNRFDFYNNLINELVFKLRINEEYYNNVESKLYSLDFSLNRFREHLIKKLDIQIKWL